MSVKRLLKSTVTVQAMTSTQSVMGGNVKTFANKTGLVNVPAGFKAKTGGQDGEGTEFSKTTQSDLYRMYASYDSATATIAATDRVIWGSKTLEVLGDAYNPGGRNVLFHVECEMIK